MNRRAIIVIVLVVVLVLVLALLTRHYFLKQKEEIITLTLWEGTKSILHLPLYIAMAEGYFQEQGIRLKVTGGKEKPGTYDAGAADLVFADPAAYLYHKSIKPELPVIVAVIASRDDTFLVSRERETPGWKDLEGKAVISYPPETGRGLALDMKLRAGGTAPYRKTALYNRIPLELRPGVFKAGSGDYIQLTGPEAVAAELNGDGFIALPVSGKDDLFPAVVCTASREVIKEHPRAVQGFINAIYKAQLWLNKEKELGLATCRTRFGGKEHKIAEIAYEKYYEMGMWQHEPWLDESHFNILANAMKVSGQLPASVSFGDSVDNTFARLAAETVQYIPPEERDKNWLQKITGVLRVAN